MSDMADTAGAYLSRERLFVKSIRSHLKRFVGSVDGGLVDLFWVLRMKSQALSGSIVHL